MIEIRDLLSNKMVYGSYNAAIIGNQDEAQSAKFGVLLRKLSISYNLVNS